MREALGFPSSSGESGRPCATDFRSTRTSLDFGSLVLQSAPSALVHWNFGQNKHQIIIINKLVVIKIIMNIMIKLTTVVISIQSSDPKLHIMTMTCLPTLVFVGPLSRVRPGNGILALVVLVVVPLRSEFIGEL